MKILRYNLEHKPNQSSYGDYFISYDNPDGNGSTGMWIHPHGAHAIVTLLKALGYQETDGRVY